MSLYIIGVLFRPRYETVDLRAVLNDTGRLNNLIVHYETDLEDLAIFREIFDSLEDAVPFVLADNLSCSDATSAWLEATNAARELISGIVSDTTSITPDEVLQGISFPVSYYDSMKCTRLGKFLFEIMANAGIEDGAIWIADGSPDGIIQLSAEECLNEILKTMVLSWDCLPNLAYAWRRFGHPTRPRTI